MAAVCISLRIPGLSCRDEKEFQNNSSVSMPLLFFLLFQNNRRWPNCGASPTRPHQDLIDFRDFTGD